MDKGTLIRTVLLVVALINQTLIMVGKPVLPVDEHQLTNLIDNAYLWGSTAYSIVMILVAWYKNNFVTKKGKAQKEVLKKHGLTKAK
ncbi:holin [Bacillus phage Stills]|uniref:Holin n=1 Tax=Bacillus phage Stills TaxID=1610833 RepID=A0A0E3T7M8_9CAUD|nr:holin [Bacillus phage Stills]AKC02685.1 holin [Bacillus phage Stills]